MSYVCVCIPGHTAAALGEDGIIRSGKTQKRGGRVPKKRRRHGLARRSERLGMASAARAHGSQVTQQDNATGAKLCLSTLYKMYSFCNRLLLSCAGSWYSMLDTDPEGFSFVFLYGCSSSRTGFFFNKIVTKNTKYVNCCERD